MKNIDKIGGPEGYNHYAIGWAHAMCTPYQWTKQIASHWGETRTGTIVNWPAGIKAKGELRTQFCHLIDVAPTVLELAGLPEPTTVNGITQEPMPRVSMAYSFEDPDAPERHDTQYFEIVCNRGIYHRGWSAVSRHHLPWEQTGSGGAPDDDVWELYDGTSDWTQAHDLAAEHPEKLAELQRLFLDRGRQVQRAAAGPADGGAVQRRAGRPPGADHRQLARPVPGMRSLTENTMLNLKNKSHSVTAEVVSPTGGAEGVLVNQGGITGGWSLYLKDGTPTYHYSFIGLDRFTVTAAAPLAAGEHQVRMEFAYDGGGLGKGGTVTLYIDGDQGGSGRVERTHAFVFSLDETTDVGSDTGSPVCEDYPAVDNRFTGAINWIRIDIGQDSHDHLIDPGQLMQLAMSRQ